MIKRLILVVTILGLGYVGLVFLTNGPNSVERTSPVVDLTPNNAYAGICFLSGEQESGMNKICYYDCLSGTVAITIKSYKLCPLSIDR